MTKDRFELGPAEAEFFARGLAKFREHVDWSAFETFAFNPGSPIYARRKSYGRLVMDPLYRALQDMWLQLGVNQGEVQDDRPQGEKSFCHAAEQGREQAGRARATRTALR
ncbi:MAG: hypothetical protein HYR57_03690 [Candidatus Koribacter versatilis]|nr:hypothetical protein [Candidatus Koribacter versatilis]